MKDRDRVSTAPDDHPLFDQAYLIQINLISNQ